MTIMYHTAGVWRNLTFFLNWRILVQKWMPSLNLGQFWKGYFIHLGAFSLDFLIQQGYKSTSFTPVSKVIKSVHPKTILDNNFDQHYLKRKSSIFSPLLYATFLLSVQRFCLFIPRINFFIHCWRPCHHFWIFEAKCAFKMSAKKKKAFFSVPELNFNLII
jgi:hypothetical protein